MKLIYRYRLEIEKQARSGGKLEVVVSFYRRQLDAAYRNMLVAMFDAGDFDNFICSLLQGLLIRGKIAL